MSGSPALGDSFTITRNTGAAGGAAGVIAVGDDGNIRALVDVRDIGGSGGTIEASLDATVTGIASTLSETRALAASATAVRNDAARANDAVGGVNLD